MCSYYPLIILSIHLMLNTEVILRATRDRSTGVQSSSLVFCEILQGTVCIHADKSCKSETGQVKIDLSFTVEVSVVPGCDAST